MMLRNKNFIPFVMQVGTDEQLSLLENAFVEQFAAFHERFTFFAESRQVCFYTDRSDIGMLLLRIKGYNFPIELTMFGWEDEELTIGEYASPFPRMRVSVIHGYSSTFFDETFGVLESVELSEYSNDVQTYIREVLGDVSPYGRR